MVPITVSAVFAVYIVLVLVSSIKDMNDSRKSNIVRLIDNSPYDRQKYYISLETGFRKGAGTTAKVFTLE